SPFFKTLPLQSHGLNWIFPPAELAHPLDDGTAVMLERDVSATAAQFGSDAVRYRELFEPIVTNWHTLLPPVLEPLLRVPRHPLLLAKFGLRAIQPAAVLARNSFASLRARALFAGLGAHSILKLEAPLSASYGLMLGAAGHAVGWPVPRGGSQQIANSLARTLESLGGRIITGCRVQDLPELGSPDLTLCDITPRQFLRIADLSRHAPFRHLLERYRYGPGVFKVDWALREPIPWKARDCFRAGTVHLGGTLEEIAASERAPWDGKPPQNPFIILAQPSLFDPTRAPADRHTAWAYCHVPNGWQGSALTEIERQIERFAPGFRECVLARAVHGPADLEKLNENLIGGDVGGGAADAKQFLMRPTWRTYSTPLKGVFLCSSSTPPGAGVHGMCGYGAAKAALRWLRSTRKI
ncbi:MAG: NAD(P)/FAD-dependent oxidoreductase, partial [Acidobacteria bacterium]|nr:NAD(P)/FAD-dependent oxidoreductase [Acidobacteriota bacterium]